MKKFNFRFDKLLEYRRSRRDLCRQLLAQLLADQSRLVTRRKSLERQRFDLLDELRGIGRHGAVDVDRSASRRYYAGQLVGEIRLAERNLELLGGQLQLCRGALTEADRDVKVLEKLQERRLAEYRYESERRSAREMEEAWLNVQRQ